MVMSILADEVDHWLCAGIISLAGAATSIIFVATKVLSRQTRLLSRQMYGCRDKIMLVATKYFCRVFFATKLLSQQAYFCRDQRRVLSRQNFCAMTRQK